LRRKSDTLYWRYIDLYESFKGFDTVELQEFALPYAEIFSAKAFAFDVISGKKVCPFSTR